MTIHSLVRSLSVGLALMATTAFASPITDGFDDGNRQNSPNGLNWYGINGTTSTGSPKPGLEIIDDTAGIGSGDALSVEGRGSNSELIAVFGQTVSLGSQTGDKLVMSFDFRVNGPNLGGELRFGGYQDTDNQLGIGGWGTSDGDFDAESPGAIGDTGIFIRLPLTANGDSARINDEANVNNILGGSGDADFIASPDAGSFTGITDDLKHTVTFVVERLGPGVNDLLMTLDVDGLNSFGGSDSNDTIVSVVSWDYFAAVTTSDTDWIIDNFSIEAIAIPEPTALMLAAMAVTGLLARRR
ncbi:PEP-CTERM sorting domain-containing protein [Botrimarina hoheduenensis]|uniref:PEP-CTERM protein-sorting domain-containing protein n=1 Tax=Botrimarina hoheduenensis TaxID=2528000 RepID=A0A5C5W9C5_9BACT|nr:PEP-CTERM sorting domain-containing protein [Botrimarina hoheduenensis]TWT46883.1 hypothetical protein Pla111_19850 [Botrimarina hoheduenensis]